MADQLLRKTKRGRKKNRSVVRLDAALAKEVAAFLFSLGNEFVRIQNADAAFDCFKYCLDLDEKNHTAVYNLGVLYSSCGRPESARRMLIEASRMDPEHLMTKIALAEVCTKMGLNDEAYSLVMEVLEKDPRNQHARSGKAMVHYNRGELAPAMEWNQKALEVNPHDVMLNLNRALINMVYGDWPQWWAVYEQTLSYGKNQRMAHLRQPDSWQGQECPGQILAVISDQGAGDAIQFGRFLPLAKELGKFRKIVYAVQPDVLPIVSRIPGIDEVVAFEEREKLPRDQFVSLLGMMRALRISPNNCLLPDPITTDPGLDELWRARIDREWDGASKKIGLVWAGDPGHGNDLNRSIPLAKLGPVLAVEGAQFYSLQVGQAAQQQDPLGQVENAPAILEFGSMLRNYADTASALKALDLLICVDTSIAHLAGCIGTEAWMLLPNPGEWRHLLDHRLSPWYGTVEIFRQGVPKDWGPPVLEVAARLRVLCGSSRREAA